MAKILFFPKQKVKLTEEETKEYQQTKEEIAKIKGLRDLFYCRRKVKAFLRQVEERNARA